MDEPQANSLYSEQLKRGWGGLNFLPPLEQEYRRYCAQGIRWRFISTTLLAVLIWAIFWLTDGWRQQSLSEPAQFQPLIARVQQLRLGVMLVLLLALAVLALARDIERALWAVFLMGLAMADGAALALLCYQRMGLPSESSVLVLAMVTQFMPIGARFRWHLALALSFLSSVLIMAVLTPEEALRDALLRIWLVLLLTLLACAFGAYWREYLRREQFLHRGLAQWLALHDELTGLSNRRLFKQQLQTTTAQAARDERPLALMLIDVDHFKRYNDRYGHDTGDRALQHVAAVLAGQAQRPLDLAARMGGEEMALLLYDIRPEQLGEHANAVVAAMAAEGLPHEDSPTAPVLTLSLGAALMRPGEGPERLYQRADALLYRAKNEGRNCACVEGSARGG